MNWLINIFVVDVQRGSFGEQQQVFLWAEFTVLVSLTFRMRCHAGFAWKWPGSFEKQQCLDGSPFEFKPGGGTWTLIFFKSSPYRQDWNHCSKLTRRRTCNVLYLWPCHLIYTQDWLQFNFWMDAVCENC